MSLAVFPTASLPGIGFPVPRTQIWSGVDQTALSGARARFSHYSYPRWRYKLPLNFLRSGTQQEFQTLAGFIAQQFGSVGLWLFNDVQDNTVAAQAFGQGDGATVAFQLVRTLGGFTEPVFFPDLTAGKVTQITVAGTPTTAYTVTTKGVINFNAAPAGGAALGWSGTYKWGCRFVGDEREFSYESLNLYTLKELVFDTEKIL